ncbi:MAG: carbamoyltransferase HypF [Syntrophorhabdus sp.]
MAGIAAEKLTQNKPATCARRIHVAGVVQGVGFRPFIYGLAHRHALKGWVMNTTSGVVIEVEGAKPDLRRFQRAIIERKPAPARVERIRAEAIPMNGHTDFMIRSSEDDTGYGLVSPDIAMCGECRKELFDPNDRRYMYPFINCTNCGPRFTIARDIPYDRNLTTMAAFTLCPACLNDYTDPSNRRFHAQPNACPACGPRIWLAHSSASGHKALEIPDADSGSFLTLKSCAQMLAEGKIIAVKGLGGFHLACDATNPRAVKTLRERKRRIAKPLAVMAASLDEIRVYCHLTPCEKALLGRPSCPIVLLRRLPGSPISREVAPGNNYLGMLLPYTPLHHILLHIAGRPLVMTSGNLSEEPITRTNEEAWERLKDIADGFIFHNREIYARYDDGVWFVPSLPGEDGKEREVPQPVRRSRGDAPIPVKLSFASRPLLACGASSKNTFCFAKDRYAFLSQHIGDMDNFETLEHFASSVRIYEKLFRIKPEAIIYDLHPNYASTHYAMERAAKEALPVRGVQHHHAHAVSCLVDNGTSEPVIAAVMDGTGYGLDGRIWGGEWLIANEWGFRRVASLEPLPLPGGDTGVRHPGRLAIAYLSWLFGPASLPPSLMRISDTERRMVAMQVQRNFNLAWTTSCGRLFDVVAAIAGGCLAAHYEAQAAIEMEAVCRETAKFYAYDVCATDQYCNWGHVDQLPECVFREISLQKLLSAIVLDARQGKSLSLIGSKFHRAMATMVGEVSRSIADESGLNKIVLSGGCFQNRLFLKMSVEELIKRHLKPMLHHQVPANDAGISLGQAAIGHCALM